MGATTADTQSSGSSIPGSTQTRSENIFSDRALALVLRAATVHTTIRHEKEVVVDPKEHTTVALWEDLYNKVFLRGYSNNSQWYPVNETGKQMDVCTFYFADTTQGFRKISLIFTEGKRANNATSRKRGETLYDLEIQLGDYCKQWLQSKRPDAAEDRLYANAVCGPYIRCFRVTLDPNDRVVMSDCISGQLGRVAGVQKEAYLDVRNVEDQRTLHNHFTTIKRDYPPGPDRPSSRAGSGRGVESRPSSRADSGVSSSRPSSGVGSAGGVESRPGSSEGNGESAGVPARRPNTPGGGSRHPSGNGSPMSIVNSGSERASPEAEAARRRAGRAAGDGRSASPTDQPRPIRQRSDQ